MRQRRWIKLLSDYDCKLKYHPGKENVVADALSRKERLRPSHVRALGMLVQTSLKSRILVAQQKAIKEENLEDEAHSGADHKLETWSDGVRYLNGRAWILKFNNLRKVVMDEAHRSRYSIHLGADKMYMDVEHQKLFGLLQQPKIPMWKWERITMDFVTKLPRTTRGHDSIWVVGDRLTKPAHFLPMQEDYKIDKLSQLYINEIVTRHGVTLSIISDRDNRRSERANDTEDGRHVTGLCDRLWRSPLYWLEMGGRQLMRLDIIQETNDKIMEIKGRGQPGAGKKVMPTTAGNP
ncbi:hypothetical protein Tco_1201992 [Tanacetum coccineum]